MKKSLIVLLVILVLVAITLLRFLSPEDIWLCENGKWIKHGNPSEVQPVTSCVGLNEKQSVSEKSIIGTYIGHLANDVYILTILSQQGESFTGILDIKNFEKDSSTGTLVGTYKNGILLADYTFQSEGTLSVGWVAFKKVTNGFIRGFGNVESETKTQSIDSNQLTFDSSVVYELSDTIKN